MNMKMKQKSKRLSIIKGKNDGATLVELVVTFALIAIFMLAVMSMVGSYMTFHFKSQNDSYAQNIADLVLNRAAAELKTANGKLILYNDAWTALNADAIREAENPTACQAVQFHISGNDAYTEVISANQSVCVMKRDDEQDAMVLEENSQTTLNGLCYLYRMVSNEGAEYIYEMQTIDDDLYYPLETYTVPYGSKTYMGFGVELKFSIPPEALTAENRVAYIKMTVTVTNTRYGFEPYTEAMFVRLNNAPEYSE